MTTTTTLESAPQVSTESRNWATMTHLSAFVGLFGIPSLFGPLAVWLLKKDDPYIVEEAIEALNFNISFLLYAVVAGISIIALVGVILLPMVLITWFVLTIVAAVRTSDGETYRYPFTIRFVN
jgi:uncharacterized Tic20 family protein